MAKIDGTAGNDTLSDTTGDDTIKGKDGADKITVHAGTDSVDGGLGDDTLVVDYSGDAIAVSSNGAITHNSSGYSGSFAGSDRYVFFSGVEHFDIRTGSGDDYLDLSSIAAGAKVTTNDGNDTVYGGSGVDTISTGGGDDFVSFHLGSTVDLGTGANGIDLDASTVAGPISLDLVDGTYSGIAGLTGTLAYVGTFYSGSGNDSLGLGALSYNEQVYGGGGDDTLGVTGGFIGYYGGLYGGAGTDKLVIDDSADTFSDYLYAGADATGGLSGQIYNANFGASTSFGSIEQFDITTGSGDDQINLGLATTSLHVSTGGGDDTVDGGSGADSIDVGDGNNLVDGGAGADTITAGSGDDTVSALDPGAVVNVGTGSNTVSLDRSTQTQDISFDLPHGTNSGVTNFTGAVDHLGTFYSGSGNDSFILGGFDSYEQVYGGAGNDTLSANFGSLLYGGLYGGTGTDKLIIDDSADTYNAGLYESSDPDGGISGQFQTSNNYNYTNFGSIEQFDVTTGSGDDYIDLQLATVLVHVVTGGGADTVLGGSGADSIDAGDGNNSVDGGAGADAITAGSGDDTVSALDPGAVVNVGTGSNTVSLDRSFETQSISFDLPHGTYSGVTNLTGAIDHLATFYSGSGNDSFVLGALNPNEHVYGGGGNDNFSVTGGFSGNNGAEVYGGSGTDKLIIDGSADTSRDYIYGGTDANGGLYGELVDTSNYGHTYFGSIEQFDVKTGSGDDLIYFDPATTALRIDAGAGNDSINGGSGADLLYGKAGNDTIDGGTGADILNGGDGDDTYYVDNARDQVVEAAGGGTDTVYVSLSAWDSPDNIETIHYTGGGSFKGRGDSHANTIYADNAGAASLHGADGNDTLYGSNGDDSLYGDGGSDVVYGGSGNDFIRSLTGEGPDSLYGGDGTDLLTLERTNVSVALHVDLSIGGNQSIGDGSVVSGFEQLRFAGGSGGDYERGGAMDDVLKGNGGADTLLGGTGADILQGGAGQDSVTGGAGVDTFRFDGPIAGYDDTVTDFITGTDKVALSKTGFGIATLADFDIVNASTGPTSAHKTLIVDTVNHTISWDADGNGAGTAVLLAHGNFTTSVLDYTLF